MAAVVTSPKPKVLFILTSYGRSDQGVGGWYLPEFAHPYHVLAPHADIYVASPAGGEAPIDQTSVDNFKSDGGCQTFYKEKGHIWKNTNKIEEYVGKAADFELIFVVGGHGPLFDLTENPPLQKLLAEAFEAGKVVAGVCHGSCAFLNVTLSDGTLLIKDEPVTGFSNDEEELMGLTKAVPFLVETELTKKGAKYEKASAPWGAHVSVGKGGRLITGQNPASAGGMAEVFLKYYESGRK